MPAISAVPPVKVKFCVRVVPFTSESYWDLGVLDPTGIILRHLNKVRSVSKAKSIPLGLS